MGRGENMPEFFFPFFNGRSRSKQGRGSHILVQTGHDEMIKFDRVCEGYLQIKEHLMFVDLKAEIDA